MTSDFFRVVNEARRHSLGPFSPSFNIQTVLLEGLQKQLPADAHKRVSGRLHISLTRVYDGKNVIISEFDSREEVLQALLCACFIPGFSGIIPPKFRGVRYMDGAFSDNLPILDENTITVSPFCGESDICPRDQSSQLFHLNWANTSIEISRQNINRFVRILFPPRVEFLSKFCQQGFDDALQFLHRNNLINCKRCIEVQSTYIVSETIAPQAYEAECSECKEHRKDALSSNMPDTVLDVIDNYIQDANKGLANWIFKHRGIKLLSLPATVPMDFFLATISKISDITPKLTKQMRVIAHELIDQLNNTMQIRFFNKLTLYDQPHFDATGLLYSNRMYGPRLSIIVDECGVSSLETDVLKMAAHNKDLYAYYYNESNASNVQVKEIFDVEDDAEQSCIVTEWTGSESDLFIDTQTSSNENTNSLIRITPLDPELSSYPEADQNMTDLRIQIDH
ncbi:bmm [Drosophila busckii]|uniref:triacylglycerol lipase n=2 Tax=Drosophila busckii TaxID=30019 RepID=A0A0M5JB55_DROBS|nr:bmm [Drosophila busckii]